MAGGGGGLARGPILGDLMGLLATCRSKLITGAGFLGVTAAACFMAGPVGAMGAAALYSCCRKVHRTLTDMVKRAKWRARKAIGDKENKPNPGVT